MTGSDISTFINSVGLPTALVVFACVAVWKWGWYVITKILHPLGEKAITFLQHVMDAINKLVDSNEVTNDQMRQQSENIQGIRSTQESHGKDIHQIKQLLRPK